MTFDNYKKVKQVLWIILFANFAVALLKILIGLSINSSSMTADGFHAISDGSSNIVGLIGIAFASKAIDKEHPYGHNKFEILTGLFIGGMLSFISINIIINSFVKFSNPLVPSITTESLIALIITIFINIFVSTYEYKIGKKLNSYILISDSLHTRSDIVVSIGVLATLIGIKLGLPAIVDPIASLVVAAFVIHTAYEILSSTICVLVDTATVDEDKIKSLIFDFNLVKDVHNIRSRGSDNAIYIDMHVMVEPNISVEESHALAHNIELKIQDDISNSAQVIIHIEPFYDMSDDTSM